MALKEDQPLQTKKIEPLSLSPSTIRGSIGSIPFNVYLSEKKYFSKVTESFRSVSRNNSIVLNENSSEHSEPTINFFFNDNKSPLIELPTSNTALVSGPLSNENFVNQLPHICYALSEKYRQETLGQISIHASAVEKDGQGILILGDKGSGKTNFLIALCKNHEYNFVGNDLVVIGAKDKLSLVFGNHQINVRTGTTKELLPDIFNRYNLDDDGISNCYEKKASLYPAELNINCCLKETPLLKIVRINLHNSNPEFRQTRVLSPMRESLRLNEALARYIRGQTTPLMLSSTGEIEGYFPSFDNSELCSFRNNTVYKMLHDTDFSYVSGFDPLMVAKRFSIL
ncbi:hypothetical protein KBB92_02525 [Candidatus Shapirobacteria bacterium]|nr:hypothetical protein [Candidatus Shapirobacteria bacterium]